ncbi:MAG: mechanosensitive ion channel domain-containing protein [Saprospiraceae bacterium]
MILELSILTIFSFLILKNWTIIKGLLSKKKFDINDYVLINGEVTRVKKIGQKNLILQVNKNSEVLVPLRNIDQEAMINLSKNWTPSKVHMAFKTSNKINVKKIKNVILQLLENHAQIIEFPRPYISIVKMRNEDIVFHLNFYSYNSREIDKIENELKMEILDAFNKRNISHLLRSTNSIGKVNKSLSNN